MLNFSLQYYIDILLSFYNTIINNKKKSCFFN